MRKSFAKTTETKETGVQTTLHWLSNTFFRRFDEYGEIWNESRWTVTRQSVEGHATVGRTSNYVFSTFQAIRKHYDESHWTVTRQWSEVTRLSADCQTTFFQRFEQLGNFLKQVTERSRGSGRRSRDLRFWVINPLFSSPLGYRRIVNPSTTCSWRSLTCVRSFSAVSWKLCNCMSKFCSLSD